MRKDDGLEEPFVGMQRKEAMEMADSLCIRSLQLASKTTAVIIIKILHKT